MTRCPPAAAVALLLASACAHTGAAPAATAASVADAPRDDGMRISRAAEQAPRCFADHDDQLVCPVTGRALPLDEAAAARLAAQQAGTSTCAEGDTACQQEATQVADDADL